MTSPAADHFLREWANSLKRFEKAEQTFRDVGDAYTQRYGPGVTADYRAASDPDLRLASGDCSYYRDRAVMYGIAALVQLRLDEAAR